MPGPQFAHIQTWSRKPNQAGQSIAQIIAEATRDPAFSTHVEAPQPPRLLLGDPSTFAADHAAHVAARSTLVRKSDGTEATKTIRVDRHTMASIVMSYPVPYTAIKTDADRAALARWEQRNMDWLKEKYGTQLRVVMSHPDETYPHLHAWLLPDDPGADATTLHPGKVAKRQVEALAKANSHEPREAVKLGNRALKAAMTIWQDEYHAAVGVPEGLTRSGPKRRRLTREQWKAEKATATAHAVALDRAEAAKAQADQIDAKGQKVQQQVGQLKGVHAALDRREKALSDREAGAEARAAEIVQGAKAEAKTITEEAEGVRADVMADAMRMADDMHRDRQHLAKIMKAARALLVKIGKGFGLDLDAKEIAADVAQIERALSAPPEDPRKESDRDVPGF